jgi:hypothetical protein
VRGYPSNSSLPLRERTKVRGAVKFFSLHQPSPPAGEGRVRGLVQIFSFSFSFSLSTSQERTMVRASVFLLTFKNKFFIIPLEKGVQNGVFAMNSLDENYAYAILSFSLTHSEKQHNPTAIIKTFLLFKKRSYHKQYLNPITKIKPQK